MGRIIYPIYEMENHPFMFQSTNQIVSRCPFTKSLGAEASSFQMPSTTGFLSNSVVQNSVLVPTGPTGPGVGSRFWS